MDNPPDQGFTPNPVPHVHHYVLKGSGLSCWAECEKSVIDGVSFGMWTSRPCGEKLAGDNGPIVGGRVKIENAIKEAT